MLLLNLFMTLLGVASATRLSARVAEPVEARDPVATAAAQSGFRILSLGASITNGIHSTYGNGYRSTLRNLLAPTTVTYIGNKCSGNMTDGNNEGHPGFVISQMAPLADPDLALKPNIILIYVGTNDMLYPIDPSNAPARMATLVSHIASKVPGSLIVVGNLFLDTNPAVEARITTFNQALPGALAPLQANGTNVVIADMASVITAGDLYKDGEHPVNSGYTKMAQVFADSIKQAQTSNKIPQEAQNVPKQLKICNGTPLASSGTATLPTGTSATDPSATDPSSTSLSPTSPLSSSSTASSTATNTKSPSLGVKAFESTIRRALTLAILTTALSML